MVFNWFRRKFGGSGEEPSPAAESPTEAPPPESTEAAASPSILNWAKTALQSIQARQQAQRSPTVETTAETQGTATAEPAAADAPLPVSIESAQAAVADEPAAVQPIVAAEPGEPDPSPILDEGFLWSAAVLAAQGRRPEEVDIEEITWLQRLRQGLGKTRRGLVHQLRAIVGQGPLSRDAVEAIEMLLLQADVGVKATDQIIAALQTKIRQETLPADQAIASLKEILQQILDRPFQEGYQREFAPKKGTLNIWLITGVNGVGKTTTIGKLAHIATQSGYRCLIAAADTFRAAATEQVKIWGQRSNVEVIANPGKNTDPAAVVFDAIGAAQARGTELLLVDTAGRLQNKANLMEELKKIRRIIDKKAGDAQIESLLVLDATLGQNGLRQAQIFAEAAQLTGVILTKLDGTAKGGVALAVVQELGLPIRFIGAGEGIKDLRPFSSFEFVEALLSSDVEVAA
ncbi:MAG: signal recognition particle receptor FtsY [Thermosynechococcus sp.]|uniref:signal recognition particle-docking protein FtsY n=1 Tax=Thermosynechococcus sp. TaxID=2814275 RepID=UPI0021FF29E6|nr:signal recognition particle-docking protein FtsY [Thermosynechococcus sp.]BCX12868.1 MAG: signal recognition particle receptor FtsY [Thermosynechococcus sp.]